MYRKTLGIYNIKKSLVFLATLLLTSPLFANGITNKEFLKACKDTTPTAQNFCLGFTIATANAAQFYRNIVDFNDEYVDICFPKDLSNQEIVKDYFSWIEKNPSLLDSPAFLGLSASFSIKYSCPQKKQNNKKKLNID